MSGSVAPPFPPRSPSPAPGSQIVPGSMPFSGGHGLVPVVRFTYAAPGGAYRGLHLNHVEGCHNESLFFTDEVRRIVSHLDLCSFNQVETVCTGILAARSCAIIGSSSARCHVDRTTSLGFYIWFHSPEGSS